MFTKEPRKSFRKMRCIGEQGCARVRCRCITSLPGRRFGSRQYYRMPDSLQACGFRAMQCGSGCRLSTPVKTLVGRMEPYRPPPDAMHVDVRFWPIADIGECTAHVRFWGG